MFEIDEGAAAIIDKLEHAGFSAYVVGGAVRDLLAGNTPNDYDIATSALPEYVKGIFKRTVDTGLKHGTVTVILNRRTYEVTTYRTESGYADSRHPDSVSFVRTIEEDLARRDFTINAMAYNPKYGLRDLYGGRADMEAGIIRAVGDPDVRFNEDPLRMLRAVRFSAKLGFDIEPATAAAARSNAALIRHVSNERILSELTKTLMSARPERIRALEDLGLMKYIIPELDECFHTPQKNKYHIYNVGDHIIEAVKNTRPDSELRWAALMHDIGKPYCLSRDASGTIHFYGHHRISAEIADRILHTLHMDNATIKAVLQLVECHDVRVDATPTSVKRMLARLGDERFFKLLDLQEADSRAKNPAYIKEKIGRIDRVRTLAAEIIAERQPYQLSDLAVNGRDLIKCGYKAGREIGDTLKTLLDEVILDPRLNEREYLLKRARELKHRKTK